MPSPTNRCRRAVVTVCAGGQPRSDHERASQAWVARRLAELAGWEYAGEYDPAHPPALRPYFVPDDTLTAAQAARLGIAGEDDLFGGVVPHAFIASKVITHGLPRECASAPEGWRAELGERLRPVVLDGFSAFCPHSAGSAGRELLARGGAIRLKPAQARGGQGQQRVEHPDHLEQAVAALDLLQLQQHGMVLEQDLVEATTCSVGQVRIAGLVLSYLGTQQQAPDREGLEVYTGSRLQVVTGGYEALEAVAGDAFQREALDCARRYDAAVAEVHPGFYASRRNYDVIAGRDARGRWRCGVLEQSWRLGGASPAEVVALDAFLSGRVPRGALTASCHESHDLAHRPPPHAQVHFHDPFARRGPVLKYAVVHGNPP
ncbi:DUF3182 family protein [Pseudoxanthomonas sp. SGNA-20]|uniref:DUF3182 family protein n=1 Tax=Pseudoxanthomonas sp. SGNA-20 TaxID=2493088 RepID=UPI001F23743E|nr:DUF3182 family protein [Pseudoxanthomonas sp. SGNA-20]